MAKRDAVVQRLISSAGGYAVQVKHGPDTVAANARRGLEEGPKSWKAKARAAADDPDLSGAELERRAELLKKQHFALMSARSIAARRKKAS